MARKRTPRPMASGESGFPPGPDDGITEPENEYGEMFGEERLIELIAKNVDREEAQIIESVMESVRQWTGVPELSDDMTVLLARKR